MKNVPQKIYLNLGDDAADAQDFKEFAEVSWCSHKVDESDIEYVLAETESLTADVEGPNEDEMWDKYSELIEDDSASFDRFANMTVVTRCQFRKLFSHLTQNTAKDKENLRPTVTYQMIMSDGEERPVTFEHVTDDQLIFLDKYCRFIYQSKEDKRIMDALQNSLNLMQDLGAKDKEKDELLRDMAHVVSNCKRLAEADRKPVIAAEFDNLLARYYSLPSSNTPTEAQISGWISVSDQLPEINAASGESKEFQITNGKKVTSGFYNEEEKMWRVFSDSYMRDVTHYKDLSNPPTA